MSLTYCGRKCEGHYPIPLSKELTFSLAPASAGKKLGKIEESSLFTPLISPELIFITYSVYSASFSLSAPEVKVNVQGSGIPVPARHRHTLLPACT